MNNLRDSLLIVANMLNFIFSSGYFVWDCFVCFLGTILSGTVFSGNILLFGTFLSGTVLSGTVLSVHQRITSGAAVILHLFCSITPFLRKAFWKMFSLLSFSLSLYLFIFLPLFCYLLVDIIVYLTVTFHRKLRSIFCLFLISWLFVLFGCCNAAIV